jgi:hypothetical protein
LHRFRAAACYPVCDVNFLLFDLSERNSPHCLVLARSPVSDVRWCRARRSVPPLGPLTGTSEPPQTVSAARRAKTSAPGCASCVGPALDDKRPHCYGDWRSEITCHTTRVERLDSVVVVAMGLGRIRESMRKHPRNSFGLPSSVIFGRYARKCLLRIVCEVAVPQLFLLHSDSLLCLLLLGHSLCSAPSCSPTCLLRLSERPLRSPIY